MPESFSFTNGVITSWTWSSGPPPDSSGPASRWKPSDDLDPHEMKVAVMRLVELVNPRLYAVITGDPDTHGDSIDDLVDEFKAAYDSA